MARLHRGDEFVVGPNEMTCLQWHRHLSCDLVTGLPWVLYVYLVSNDKACRITFRLIMSHSFVAASHHSLTQSRKEEEVLSQGALHILFHSALVQGLSMLFRWELVLGIGASFSC